MKLRLLQIATIVAAIPIAPLARTQSAAPQPLVIQLDGSGGYQELLKGAPQTAGVRSGFVRLKPGETVGWHTTGQHEETLVILHGKGAALIDGHPDRPFVSPAVTYIPPATRHNVQNTGNEPLEYVYVVAPIPAK
jgi:mannose-6-phosphate isomerase-like protein (cupin superfamily)